MPFFVSPRLRAVLASWLVVLLNVAQCSTIPCAAQSPTPQTSSSASTKAPTKNSQAIELNLPNGMKIVFIEEHSFPVVSVLMTYRVGSRNEAPGVTGLSHLVEHMLMQNIGNFRKGEVGATIVRSGGQFNGFTSDDFTVFFETLPPNKLDLALKIESERMRNASFTKADVQEEVARLEGEFEHDSKDAPLALMREVRASSFQQHPYRNPTSGWKGDVQKLTYEDARKFYEDYFRPSNATLILAGDFDKHAAASMIQRYFGSLPKLPAPPPLRVRESDPTAEKRVHMPARSKKEFLYVAYHAPAFQDADAPVMVVLEKVLNEGTASRLKSKLIDSKTCWHAMSAFELRKDPGLFTFSCHATPSSNAPKTLEILDGIVGGLKTQPLSEVELRTAKNHAEFTHLSERDGPYHAGLHVGYFDALDGWNSAYTWIDRIKSVSAADVQRVAKKYLVAEHRVVGMLSSSPSTTLAKPAAPAKADESEKKSDKSKTDKDKGKSDKDKGKSDKDKGKSDSHSKSEKGTKPDAPKSDKKPSKPQHKHRSAFLESDTSHPVGGFANIWKSAFKQDDRAQDNSVPDSSAQTKRVHINSAHTSRAHTSSALGNKPMLVAQATGGPNPTIPLGTKTGTSSAAIPLGTKTGAPNPALPVGTKTGASSPATGVTKTADAQLTVPSPPKTEGRVKRATLKNGITLLVFESHLSPIVQVVGATKAGSAFEPSGKRGVSTLAAHLMSNATSKLNHAQLTKAQDEIGLPPDAMIKFESGLETITFKTRCLTRDFADQIARLGGCLKDPGLQDSDVDKARSDAVQTVRRFDDRITNKVENALYRSLIAPETSYYPMDIAQTIKDLGALKAPDARAFIQSYVSPKSTTIVLTGDIDLDTATRLVERATDGWTERGDRKIPTAQTSARRVLKTSIPINNNQSEAMVMIGRLVPVSPYDEDYPALLLADCALTNHPIFSRMVLRMSDDIANASSLSADEISSRFKSLANMTAWTLSVPVEQSVVSRTVTPVQVELKKFVKTGLSPEEFAEVKRFMSGALLTRHMSSTDDSAEFILECSLAGAAPDCMQSWQVYIRNAQLEAVNRFIKTTFRPDLSSLVIAGSRKSIGQVRAASVKESSSSKAQPPAKQ